MSDETRKQGSVLPLGESLAGFLCSDGVFRVKSGEFRRATVGEWWQDKANGRVYCVNSEYPQDILAEPDLPAPSQTEGGGPDDTKQVSKEQGASPSVTPAVTTDGVPVVREGREDGELCEACQGHGVNGPVLDARCPGCQARTCHGHSEPCDSCAATGLAPSVVSGGGQNEARIEAAVEAGLEEYLTSDDDIAARDLIEEVIRAAAPFLVSASDEVTVKRSDLIRVMEQATTGMSMYEDARLKGEANYWKKRYQFAMDDYEDAKRDLFFFAVMLFLVGFVLGALWI